MQRVRWRVRIPGLLCAGTLLVGLAVSPALPSEAPAAPSAVRDVRAAGVRA